MAQPQSRNTTATQGFSLIELVIVGAIIAILNVIAIPTFQRIRSEVHAHKIANDFRVLRDAAGFAVGELGEAPPDGSPGNFPGEMLPFLPANAEKPAYANARWDWENWRGRNRDFSLGITLRLREDGFDELFERVDGILDDGDLASGSFRRERHFGGYALQL